LVTNKITYHKCNILTITGLFFTLIFFSCSSDPKGFNVADNNHSNNSPGDDTTASSATCSDISTDDFSVLAMAKIVRVEYNDADFNTVESWQTGNIETTILDYDGGAWAYFRNKYLGYLEIELTVDFGNEICTSSHVINY
jgi:hypothetical protein